MTEFDDDLIPLEDAEAEVRVLEGPPLDSYEDTAGDPDLIPPRRGNGGYQGTGLPDIRLADVSRFVGVPIPALTFAIADLVPIGMVTLLPSPGGGGKSILMQTAMTCIATGNAWLGKKTLGGAAAGVFAEDEEDVIHIRQARICERLGADMADLTGRVFPASYAGYDATLWRDGQPTPFFGQLEAQLAGIPELRLVCIDNAALVFDDNENDRISVTRFIAALTGMARRVKVAVVLSTHLSKSSDSSPLRAASGSTAWVNACRSVLTLSPETEHGPPEIKLAKSNHRKPGEVVQLQWIEGVLIARHEEGVVTAGIKSHIADRVFLDLLARVTAEGRNVSEKPAAGNYAPRLFAGRPDREGLGRGDFKRAMERLFAKGSIRVETYGRQGDQRERIRITLPSPETKL